MSNSGREVYSVAYCRSGCIVGWTSSRVPIADQSKWLSSARNLGYRVIGQWPGTVPPEAVNLQCEHR